MSGNTPKRASTPSPSNAERARNLSESALAQLTEQLEAGNSEQFTAFLNAMSRFHKYSFGNIMLIMAQRPDATHVAGFHTWKSLGRTVKKGEKGLLIIAPMLLKSKEREEHERGQDESQDRPRLRFRAVHVFDIAQTEGDPLPEPAKVCGDPGDALGRLETAIRATGITLEDSEELGGAEGVSTGGRILIRPGQMPAERFSTIVHEWAHELLHQIEGAERPPKVVRETEAEAVAFVVGQSIGLDTGTASADYIRLYQGDAETLAGSMDRIQKTAAVIIQAVSGDADPEKPSKQNRVTTTSVLAKAGRPGR